MKHIKAYENVNSNGDYIIVTNDTKYKIYNNIVSIENTDNGYYLLEFIIIADNSYKVGNATLIVDSEIIVRLATPEEIKDYKSMKGAIKNMKKYNL
jgi:hypothetical protein